MILNLSPIVADFGFKKIFKMVNIDNVDKCEWNNVQG